MTNSTSTAWNGPICSTCGARYLGTHTCTQQDIIRRIRELFALLDHVPAATPVQGTSGGMQITYSTWPTSS